MKHRMHLLSLGWPAIAAVMDGTLERAGLESTMAGEICYYLLNHYLAVVLIQQILKIVPESLDLLSTF
jgi:hypothetical protein